MIWYCIKVNDFNKIYVIFYRHKHVHTCSREVWITEKCFIKKNVLQRVFNLIHHFVATGGFYCRNTKQRTNNLMPGFSTHGKKAWLAEKKNKTDGERNYNFSKYEIPVNWIGNVEKNKPHVKTKHRERERETKSE